MIFLVERAAGGRDGVEEIWVCNHGDQIHRASAMLQELDLHDRITFCREKIFAVLL